LPLIEDAVEKETRPIHRSESLRGAETILLVEDEEPLRALTYSVLMKSGYAVLESSNAAQAIELIQRRGSTVDLLLTDVVLPGMSGTALAEEILQTYPETKVLFMSGYTHFAASGQRVLEAGTFLLQKPFAPDELRSKVREVLDLKVCSELSRT